MIRAAAAVVALAVVALACSDSTPGTPVPSSVPPTGATVTASSTTTVSTFGSPSLEDIADVDAIFEAVKPALDATDVPGLVVMVIRDGEVIVSITHGIDPGDGGLMMRDELFQVGSISKPVTAMAVAALVEQGVIAWDDDIRDHLTSFPLRSLHDEPVTFAQLLSHTAGTTVDGFLGYPPDVEVPSVPTLLGGGGNSPEVFVEGRPGGGYSYSGGGYTLVQQALVDLTGADFTALLDELVLDPAGTIDATFAQPLPAELRARATAGSIAGAAVEPFVHPEQAAAGLWAGGPDLAQLLLSFQAALAGEATWLGADAAAYLIEPATAGPGVFVGHGFFVSDSVDPQWFWHAGRNTGYTAEIIGSVDGRDGIVVLTNALEAEVTIRQIVDAVRDIEEWEGLSR